MLWSPQSPPFYWNWQCLSLHLIFRWALTGRTRKLILFLPRKHSDRSRTECICVYRIAALYLFINGHVFKATAESTKQDSRLSQITQSRQWFCCSEMFYGHAVNNSSIDLKSETVRGLQMIRAAAVMRLCFTFATGIPSSRLKKGNN